jgi:hypothetical protein
MKKMLFVLTALCLFSPAFAQASGAALGLTSIGRGCTVAWRSRTRPHPASKPHGSAIFHA